MDCIQFLCLETEEDSAPLRWHRQTEKDRQKDFFNLWAFCRSPFSYFQPKRVRKVPLGKKSSCWRGTDEWAAGSSARVPRVCSLHLQTSDTCPK